MIIKKESKYTSPIKHMLINDAGIGSNRIVITNNYLNNYNYFNKNNIKMLQFHKKKYLENKLKAEEYKKEKSIPELGWSTSYYINFNKSNNDYLQNDKNNNELKKAEINYLHDLENYNIKFHSRKNRIRKTYKIYDDLMKNMSSNKNKVEDNNNINENKKYYSTEFNYKEKNKSKNTNKRYYNFLDETDYIFHKRKNRFSNIKCNVIFGKTLSTDHGIMLNKNKNNNYFNQNNKILIRNQTNPKKLLDEAKYSNCIISSTSSNREQGNMDLNSKSSNFCKRKIENNKKYLLKDNKLLPLIK